MFDKALEQIRNGVSGDNRGIPTPFPRLRKYWPYLLKSTYFLIFANTKIGKTSFTDDVFLYNTIDYCEKNPEFDCHISYASLEIDKRSKAVKIISRKLFWDQGIELSSRELLSQSEEQLVDNDLINFVEDNYQDFFKLFNDKVSIKDKFSTIDKNGRSQSEVNALISWLYYEANRLMPDYKSDPEKYKNFYWFIIIDHIALVGDKNDIDRLSKVLLQLRNEYGAIPVVIQQAGFDAENKEQTNAWSKGKVRPTPNIADLGDSRYTARDANVIMALFSPHAYHIDNFDGYNILRLGDSFRNLEILRDRDGATGVNVGLYFIGKIGSFVELPKASDMTPELYKYYENKEFLKNKR